MKKFHYIADISLCSMLVILLISSSAFAEEPASITGIKALSSDGAVLDVEVYNYTTGQVEDSITWSNLSQGWVLADQCLKITFSTDAYPWGIQIYTYNKNNTAPVPVYEGHGNPAGLIGCITKDQALPLAWKTYLDGDYQKIPSDLSDISWKPGEDMPGPPVVREGRVGFTDWRWHWLKDKNTPDNESTTDIDESFKDGGEYVTLWNQAGVKWNEGDRHHHARSIYVFLAADFSTATKQIYKTNTLTVELAHGYPIEPFPMYIYKDAFEYMVGETKKYTLENHYAPDGWMNGDVNMSVNDLYTNNPHSQPHCFRIHWNGEMGWSGRQEDPHWFGNGIAWLEPGLDASDNWIIDDRGYDLRGVTHLSFWARTDPQYIDPEHGGPKIKCFVGHREGDSCGSIPAWVNDPDYPEWGWLHTLTPEWKHYTILLDYPPLLEHDMSKVSLGFAIIVGKDGYPGYPAGVTSGGYTVYLDDITFEKGE